MGSDSFVASRNLLSDNRQTTLAASWPRAESLRHVFRELAASGPRGQYAL